MGCAASTKGYWEPPVPEGSKSSSSSSGELWKWPWSERRSRRNSVKEFTSLINGPIPVSAWTDAPKQGFNEASTCVSGRPTAMPPGRPRSPSRGRGDLDHRLEALPATFVEVSASSLGIPGRSDQTSLADKRSTVSSCANSFVEQPLLSSRVQKGVWRSSPPEKQRAAPHFADPFFLVPQASGSGSRRQRFTSAGSSSVGQRRDWVELAASVRKSLDGLPISSSSGSSSCGSSRRNSVEPAQGGGGRSSLPPTDPMLAQLGVGRISEVLSDPGDGEVSCPHWGAEYDGEDVELDSPGGELCDHPNFQLTIIAEGGEEEEDDKVNRQTTPTAEGMEPIVAVIQRISSVHTEVTTEPDNASVASAACTDRTDDRSVDLQELELEPRELAPRDESEATSGTSTPRAPVPLPSENRPWRAKTRLVRGAAAKESANAAAAGGAIEAHRSLPAVLEGDPIELHASQLAEQLALVKGIREGRLPVQREEDEAELSNSSFQDFYEKIHTGSGSSPRPLTKSCVDMSPAESMASLRATHSDLDICGQVSPQISLDGSEVSHHHRSTSAGESRTYRHYLSSKPATIEVGE